METKTEQRLYEVVDSWSKKTANYYRVSERKTERNVFLLKYAIDFLSSIQTKKPELTNPRVFGMLIAKACGVEWRDEYMNYSTTKPEITVTAKADLKHIDYVLNAVKKAKKSGKTAQQIAVKMREKKIEEATILKYLPELKTPKEEVLSFV